MVEELTEDHRLWEQEMSWSHDHDPDAGRLSRWEWVAIITAWLTVLVVLLVSIAQLLL